MSEEKIDIKEEELEPDVEIKDEIQENSMAQNTSIADRDKLIRDLDEHKKELSNLRDTLYDTSRRNQRKKRTALKLADQIWKKRREYKE